MNEESKQIIFTDDQLIDIIEQNIGDKEVYRNVLRCKREQVKNGVDEVKIIEALQALKGVERKLQGLLK